MSYQILDNFTGSMYKTPRQLNYPQPSYQGIEYDYEIPLDEVVSTPGGVSSRYHHPTYGFNGRGNASSDIFAGQGDQYISGIYGNLYEKGDTSTGLEGFQPPDEQFKWDGEVEELDPVTGEVLQKKSSKITQQILVTAIAVTAFISFSFLFRALEGYILKYKLYFGQTYNANQSLMYALLFILLTTIIYYNYNK